MPELPEIVCAACQDSGKLLADRALSRLLKGELTAQAGRSRCGTDAISSGRAWRAMQTASFGWTEAGVGEGSFWPVSPGGRLPSAAALVFQKPAFPEPAFPEPALAGRPRPSSHPRPSGHSILPGSLPAEASALGSGHLLPNHCFRITTGGLGMGKGAGLGSSVPPGPRIGGRQTFPPPLPIATLPQASPSRCQNPRPSSSSSSP